MATILDGLAEPFDRLPDARAAEILAEHWGLRASRVVRLDTERDDSFRAALDGGRLVVLKVAHPSDPADLIDLQVAALEHTADADPALPLQRAVPDRGGDLTRVVDGRIARVTTWLGGDLLDARLARGESLSPATLHAAGVALGRVSRALADFAHPADARTLAWDLAHVPALAPYATADTVPADTVLADTLARYTERVGPLAGLPQQVVHNDFHPGNILVRGDAVVGVLDFGDIVRTARVADLGVALAYLLPEQGPLRPPLELFTSAFEEIVPLTDDERQLIPWLVAGRQVQRLVINRALARGRGASPHAAPRTRRRLHRILQLIDSPDGAEETP